MTAVDAADAALVPAAVMAFTVNVYAVPLVSAPTVADVAPVVVAVLLPGDEVTVYPVIALPPSDTGAVHDTDACALPATAVTPVGEPGGPAGVIAADGVDDGPVLTAFLAVTMNVYAVPLVNPVTVADVAPVVVAVLPPGDAVTV